MLRVNSAPCSSIMDVYKKQDFSGGLLPGSDT